MNPTERLAWLRERQTGIGSSDAPNLIGLGYRDAASVYRSKVEPVDERPPTGNLRRGLELEPLVAEMYREVMGVELAPCPVVGGIYRHPDRRWQLCTPDRYRVDDATLVQLKTVAGFSDDWGPSGSDQIPGMYHVERQHEMGVCGAERIDLIALDVIAWEPRVYRLTFDRRLFDWLTGVEAAFMELVEHHRPPGPEWEQQFAPAAAKLMDDGTPDLGPDVAALIDRRRVLVDIGKEAEAEADRLKAEIETAMGAHAKATAGGWKLKRIPIAGGEYTATRKDYVRLDIRAARERVTT